MIDILAKNLALEEQSSVHRQLLEETKSLVAVSRNRMSSYYAAWEHHDRVYRGEMTIDQEDREAKSRKEPAKMVVPLTYSQVQTFVSFCFSLFTQRAAFFELLPMNPESAYAARVGEAFLKRDLNYNIWERQLYQFLLDIARYNIGILKTGWVRETQKVKEMVPLPMTSSYGPSMPIQPQYFEQESIVTKYLGNRIFNISPYHFFPDTRLPFSRFQDGEFCASEEVVTYTQLKQWEADGMIVGVDFIKPPTPEVSKQSTSHWPDDAKPISNMNTTATQSKGTYILTECQRIIIPKQYKINDEPIGTEDYPVKYNLWYINDNRLVKAEPLGYAHDLFTYDLGEYATDLTTFDNTSLADSIDTLQATISWFINSHIATVRKVVNDKLIVDPEGIEMKDLQERKAVIRLKPIAANRGVDKFIKQLPIVDVTSSHVTDVKYLIELAQLTTGINENLLGQFNAGRRSATEARAVNSAAASRLKMTATVIFRSACEPMGRKLLSNLRDGLDESTYVRLLGPLPAARGVSFVQADKSDLAGEYDFEIFDGTLPSEKGLSAAVLQELFIAIVQRPDVAIALQIDPKKLLEEILYLRGIRSPERFTLELPQNVQQPGTTPPTGIPANQPPTAPGLPTASPIPEGIGGQLGGLIG